MNENFLKQLIFTVLVLDNLENIGESNPDENEKSNALNNVSLFSKWLRNSIGSAQNEVKLAKKIFISKKYLVVL